MTIPALSYHSPGIGLHDFPKTYQQNKIIIKFQFMENSKKNYYSLSDSIWNIWWPLQSGYFMQHFLHQSECSLGPWKLSHWSKITNHIARIDREEFILTWVG